MFQQDISGRLGMVIAVIAWLVMTVCAVTAGAGAHLPELNTGFVLSPVEAWELPQWLGWLANMAIVGLLALFLIILNSQYNFIPGTTRTFAAAFLIMMGANTQISTQLQTTTLLAAVNLACVAMLYSQRKGRNASAEMFIIASTLSAASMWAVAYAFFIPVYTVCAIVMGLYGLRELIATLMGVVAPWICVLCFGWVDISALTEPSIIPVWEAAPPLGSELAATVLMIAVGLTAVIGCLRNLYSLNAANRSVREMFRCTCIPIAGLLVMLLLDWGHFQLYYAPMALFAAIQLGYITAFIPRRSCAVPFWCALGGGVGLFVLMFLYGG